MDFDFISKTFVRLLAALPLTLSVWFFSVVLGALIAAGVTWMRVSGRKSLELFARACGMSRLLMFRRIFFPIAVRHALPAYSTEMISMVKRSEEHTSELQSPA